MSRPNTGVYVIRPKDNSSDNLAIGIVGGVFPPRDQPVKVGLGGKIQRWILKDGDDNTLTVFAGKGNSYDFKWIVTENKDLFVSAVSPPGNFRFESAGNGLWVIGIPGQDLLLTLNRDVTPSLSFKPSDGSDNQRFQLTQLDNE